MAQWILKANGRVTSRRSLRPLKVDELHSPVEIKKREVFDELIKRRWGSPMTPSNTQQQKVFEKYEDHEQERNHLRSCMHFINLTSCPADPDVWIMLAIKSDGSKCYDYVLQYVDDALVVSENAESILRNELGRYFELKEESIAPPDHYLGGKVRKVQLENGVNAWAFSSSQYVQTAVKNVEAYLKSEDSKCRKMPNKADTPLTTTYRPELDASSELNVADAAYYQSLI